MSAAYRSNRSSGTRSPSGVSSWTPPSSVALSPATTCSGVGTDSGVQGWGTDTGDLLCSAGAPRLVAAWARFPAVRSARSERSTRPYAPSWHDPRRSQMDQGVVGSAVTEPGVTEPGVTGPGVVGPGRSMPAADFVF